MYLPAPYLLYAFLNVSTSLLWERSAYDWAEWLQSSTLSESCYWQWFPCIFASMSMEFDGKLDEYSITLTDWANIPAIICRPAAAAADDAISSALQSKPRIRSILKPWALASLATWFHYDNICIFSMPVASSMNHHPGPYLGLAATCIGRRTTNTVGDGQSSKMISTKYRRHRNEEKCTGC